MPAERFSEFPGPAHRAWVEYRIPIRDWIILLLATMLRRPGWAPPEWIAMAEEAHRHAFDQLRPEWSSDARRP